MLSIDDAEVRRRGRRGRRRGRRVRRRTARPSATWPSSSRGRSLDRLPGHRGSGFLGAGRPTLEDAAQRERQDRGRLGGAARGDAQRGRRLPPARRRSGTTSSWCSSRATGDHPRNALAGAPVARAAGRLRHQPPGGPGRRGQGASTQALDAIVLGDFVSVYLAALYGVDPTPVEAICELKAAMALADRPDDACRRRGRLTLPGSPSPGARRGAATRHEAASAVPIPDWPRPSPGCRLVAIDRRPVAAAPVVTARRPEGARRPARRARQEVRRDALQRHRQDREGKSLRSGAGRIRFERLSVTVRGDNDTHRVRLDPDGWQCTCHAFETFA